MHNHLKVKYNRPQVLINTGVTPKDRKKGKVKNAKIYNLSKKKTKNKTKITLTYYEITSDTLRVQKQPRIVHII